MRRLLALLCALFVITPAASASEPSGAEGVVALEDLIVEVDSLITFFEAGQHASLVEVTLDPDSYTDIGQRMVRADEDLGRVRSQANDYLHATLPEDAAHFLFGLDPTLDAGEIAAALDTSNLPSASVWAAASVVDRWTEFRHKVIELRGLVSTGVPERVCPVAGWTWFQNEWEVPRPWGRIHKGVDMNAAFGAELYAIEDGVVIQANWHYLGGRQVYLRADSTGDVYYYAHLEYWPRWLWTGTRLEAGDYLGLVGMSGNALSPHLHLGWMPESERVDLDNLQNAYYLMFELCE